MPTACSLKYCLRKLTIPASFATIIAIFDHPTLIAQDEPTKPNPVVREKAATRTFDSTRSEKVLKSDLISRLIPPVVEGQDHVAKTDLYENVLAERRDDLGRLDIRTPILEDWDVHRNTRRKNGDEKFHWKAAISQSLVFLGIQHGFRLTEEKTRDEFKGPFFSDWRESAGNLEGWDDGGKWFTNYIAHPLQGAITSRIFLNNSDNAMSHQFGKTKQYWTSRLKSMAWAAVWSAQFEIGPISEASLGNVGLNRHADGRSKLTYIDFVVTPVLGTGIAVAEDAIERYVIVNWAEKKFKSRLWIKFLRTVLTPTTSFANICRFKAFWWRPGRLN